MLAIIGGIGTLSVAIFTWIMGGFLDRFTAEAYNNYRERAGNVPGITA